MKKVLIAMSGGVDSSAAAMLLLAQGYEVIGVTMKLFSKADGSAQNEQDIQDAKKVADSLGISHEVLDLQTLFTESVITPFIQEYRAGDTPNPCVFCNKTIKFGALLQAAADRGCDYLATGHYAQTVYNEITGEYELHKGADPAKDQSYMLYHLTQEQLSRLLFPLGALTKPEIRRISAEHGLITAHKSESQDICFIPDNDYVRFIQQRTSSREKAGKFIHADGTVLGTHRGLSQYTIGQRKGLGIAYRYPLYVLRKDPQQNTIIVGPNEALFQNTLQASDCRFISPAFQPDQARVTAKIRYSQQAVPAVLHQVDQTTVTVRFDAPQRAITPGQAIVFYDGSRILGGGTITKGYTD